MIPDDDMLIALAYFFPAVVQDLSPTAAIPHINTLNVKVSQRNTRKNHFVALHRSSGNN